MFSIVYWVVALLFALVLPGITIIMAILYLFGCVCKPMFAGRPAASHAPEPTSARNSSAHSSTPDIQPLAVDRSNEMGAFVDEIHFLDEQRKEQELIQRNAGHHSEALDESVHSTDDEILSWQDRLEAGYGRH